MLGHNLATWAENTVKFELDLSNQMEKKTKQKRGRNGMRDKIKVTENVGSINEH